MASEYQMVGTLADAEGRIIEIGRAGGTVILTCVTGTGELYLDAAARDQLRELLDRAAMPGVTS